MRLIVNSSSSSSRTVSARTKWTHIVCDSHCTQLFCHDNIDQRNKTKFMRKPLCIFILCKILFFYAMYNVCLSSFFRIQKQAPYSKMRNCETPLFKKNRTWILVDLQLDAQNSYLFTFNTFIKILYMFRALPCSSSGSLRRNCIYAASGIVTLCRWLSCAPVKKDSHLQRVTIPEAADIQLRRRPLEDEQGNARNMQRILINVL